MSDKIELLAPVGNREKLEIAIHYGADAVYLGGQDFSLRNFSGNFSLPEMEAAVNYAHEKGVKVFVACNIYSRNNEQKEIADYLKALGQIKPDAVILADPGIINLSLDLIPEIDIHLSTQANTTNYNNALFWKKLGIKRVNVARELPLTDIKTIAEKTGMEIEAFVHGAMCISYSGRCLLSSFLAKRDANRGQCSHPCRWQYSVVEEQRQGEIHPIMEDARGTYIFNSKDLCMIEHIPELISAGITSLKIEGRMKGINYLASAVKIFRDAIDSWYENPDTYQTKPEWIDELSHVNNREYCTGFFFGHPNENMQNYKDRKPATIHRFIGKVLENKGNNQVKVGVRNRIRKGDNVEVLVPNGPPVKDTVLEIINRKGETVDVTQTNSEALITFKNSYQANDLLRNSEEIAYTTEPLSRAPKKGIS